MKHVSFLCWLLVLIGLGPLVSAQSTFRVSGRVTDAGSGAEIPFAALSLKGKAIGTTADVTGRYSLTTAQLTDSLIIVSIGYQTRAVALAKTPTQVPDIHLLPTATRLQEVKMYGKGGDPAYRVLRKAATRRTSFDPDRLTAFQYDNYSRIEAYVNDFGRKSRAKN